MDIKLSFKLKCSKCGGAKYVDEPYAVFDTWFVDIVCLSCGHSKDIPVSEFNELISNIEKASKNSNAN